MLVQPSMRAELMLNECASGLPIDRDKLAAPLACAPGPPAPPQARQPTSGMQSLAALPVHLGLAYCCNCSPVHDSPSPVAGYQQ